MAKVSLRAYIREIEAMIDRSHLDEAVAHCQHILKTFPKHLETYRLLGKAYLEDKRHNEAVDIFSRVLAAEPSDFVSHVGMSIIRDEQNKFDDAIWHMERAFEVQSANPAIQGELQRLYGRRDGVQPPRIRMTRGALAHMYMRGELYPQAISETKIVLEEDQGRSDMQVLLAEAYYRSGQKKDAADAASAVLKRYPFCLDANLVLAEILGTDRPESAQAYRHRVIELDPYAAQAVDNMFRANEVSDAAVSLEHLEWNGEPVGMTTDWATTRAIGLESGIRDDEQPEWMKNAFTQETPLSAQTFDTEQDASSSAAQPAEDIPDFLRAAGWGESSGTFDESKSSAMFEDEPASPAEPIAEGDLPDWVRAMAPQATAQPSDDEAEEMPDWINKIGTSELPVPSDDSSSEDLPDWLGGLGEPSSTATEDQPDWMKGFEQEEQPASQPVDDQPDWMKGFGEEEQPASQSSEDQPDWMKGFGQEEQPSSASDDQLDWLKDLGTESVSSETSNDVDFLDELTHESEEPVPSGQTPTAKIDTGSLGTSEQEQDDSFAWLENLAAKQGATEGLLTRPEERLEDEPEWIKQAKDLSQSASQPIVEEPVQESLESEATPPSSTDVEDLGKSGEEIDDALAWFEGLAAKQGATEGLLTKPEERKDQEPEWVKKVKSAGNARQPAPVQQPPVETPPPAPVSEPPANVEDLGKSGQEIDDALAWFEGLAAKQGATEGLLTKPEERLEQEPEWVKQAKSAAAQQPIEDDEYLPEPETVLPASPSDNLEEFGKSDEERDDALAWHADLEEKLGVTEARLDDEPDWIKPAKDLTEEAAAPSMETPTEAEPEAEADGFAPGDDTVAWLKGLEDEDAEREAAPIADEDTVAWLKSLDEPEGEPITTFDSAAEDLPAWMQGTSEEESPEAESAVPTDDASSPAPVEESVSEDVPGWLSSLEEEEQAPAIPASNDLPAWMRDETGEVVAEPTKIEPTRSSDWAPVDEKKGEEVQAPPSAPEPAPASKVESKPAPKAKKTAKKEEVKPATPSDPYKEPVTRKGNGMLTMPIDSVLGSARAELSRSNIPGALETYEKLIKKGKFLEEVIYDLREALYRYPVEVSIWQTLGDAYMRSNQLQDALDAYTKAEELLR